jgi:hypothetical protein
MIDGDREIAKCRPGPLDRGQEFKKRKNVADAKSCAKCNGDLEYTSWDTLQRETAAQGVGKDV